MGFFDIILNAIKSNNDKNIAKPLEVDIPPIISPTAIHIDQLPSNNKVIEPVIEDNFKYASSLVGEAEGGWCFNKKDKGKETIYGIARAYHPDWSGWKIVDEYAVKLTRGSKAFISAVNNDEKLKELAHNFFYTYFWLPCNADKLPKEIAILTYDMEINSGNHAGQKALQKVLNLLGYNLLTDGMAGGKTISASIDCYNSNRDLFIETFLKYRYNFYHTIVTNDKSQLTFWKGWVNRLRKFSLEFLNECIALLVY